MMASRAVRIILGVVGSLLVLVVILVGVGLYLAGSFVQKVADEIRTETLTTIRPRTTAEHVEFALTYGKDVTNLANFTVSDSQGNRLWELDCRGSGKPAVIEVRIDPEALTPRMSLAEIRAQALKAHEG